MKSATQRNAELKEYIIKRIEECGVSPEEIFTYDVFFNDKFNFMGIFAYCKGNKYCIKYLGLRKSEEADYFFDSKEELTVELLKMLITSKALREGGSQYKEYALKFAEKFDSETAGLLKKEFSLMK